MDTSMASAPETISAITASASALVMPSRTQASATPISGRDTAGVWLIALVWAFSELLVEQMKGEGIYELYHQQAKAAAQCSKPQPAQTVPQPGSIEWLKTQANKE